jgi:protein-disulfide isomerase
MTRSRTFIAILLAAAAVTALLAGASLLSATRGTGATTPTASPAVRGLFAGIPQQGLALGRSTAPVTLVEYADLQCPYCAAWARETLPVLISDYVRSGRLRIVFHGLAFLGPDSASALTAVVAAGRQDRLWDVVEALYRIQGLENSGWFTPELLAEVVGTVPGLDASQLERDRSSDWTQARIDAASSAATAAGVRGTPSLQLGPTGGRLRLVSLTSLGPEGLEPTIDSLLRG